MIDVVFLLLVFFMLASQFGLDQVLKLPLAGASQNAKYAGPPRLITVGPETTQLNGVPMSLETLSSTLHQLMKNPTDPIILRGQQSTTSQAILDVLGHLQKAGFETIVLVE